MSKSIKQQFNSSVTIRDNNELNRWLRGLLFVADVSLDKAHYYTMITRIKHLQDKCGNTWVVKYLKECNRLTMVWVSQPIDYRKSKILSVGMPVKISGGLPCVIPTPLRRKMEKGCVKTTKLVLTVLSLYRIWRCPPIMKLSTITGPFVGLSETLPILELKAVLELFNFTGKPSIIKEPIHITTAGVNQKVSSLSAPFDAYALGSNKVLFKSFKQYCDVTGNSDFYSKLDQEYREVRWETLFCFWDSEKKPLMLGKLSKKFEAAGKVRIFAITDWWTQNLFKPLHTWINNHLRLIKQDGTFDQTAPLSHLQGMYRVSYDLSAATDRLPLKLQVQILSLILGQEAAISWSILLKDRDWWLKEKEGWVPYRYAVGQPMGAYSSFPMLALTHHVIVQLAARRVGHTVWFEQYALLGDDIVIADPKVGASYLAVMRDTLGVEINLSKSLESEQGVMEFAKRLFKGEVDFTPLSPKVLLLSTRNIFHLPDLITDLVAKSFEFDASSLLTLLRRPTVFRNTQRFNVYKAVWSCFSPFGVIQQSPIPFRDIGSIGDNIFKITKDLILEIDKELFYSTIDRSTLAMKQWKELKDKERGGLPGDLIGRLPSTIMLDTLLKERPLANPNRIFTMDLIGSVEWTDSLENFRDSDKPDQEIDLEKPEDQEIVRLWLIEQFKALDQTESGIADMVSPKELQKSRGQLAFNFWSLLAKTAELPKIHYHRPRKQQHSHKQRLPIRKIGVTVKCVKSRGQ